MQVQMLNKQIGNVEIFELAGTLKGVAAARCQLQIQRHLQNRKNPFSVLFYTQGLSTVDSEGAKTILNACKIAEKCVVITRDSFTTELLLEKKHEKLFLFQNEEDALACLGKDLAYETNSLSLDKRKYARMSVAVPVKVLFTSDQGRPIRVTTVAINLSLDGMFVRFIDSQSEHLIRKHINLYDLPLLAFEIRISPNEKAVLKGKIIHMDGELKGMGIQFYNANEEATSALQKFLDGKIPS